MCSPTEIVEGAKINLFGKYFKDIIKLPNFPDQLNKKVLMPLVYLVLGQIIHLSLSELKSNTCTNYSTRTRDT